MKTTGQLIIGFLFSVIGILIQAFVILKVWAWYLIPFFNAPEIPYLGAIGLTIFFSFLKNKNITNENIERDWEEALSLSVVGWVYDFLILGLAAFFTMWM